MDHSRGASRLIRRSPDGKYGNSATQQLVVVGCGLGDGLEVELAELLVVCVGAGAELSFDAEVAGAELADGVELVVEGGVGVGVGLVTGGVVVGGVEPVVEGGVVVGGVELPLGDVVGAEVMGGKVIGGAVILGVPVGVGVAVGARDGNSVVNG